MKKQSGFTLIELAIVLVIIGLLLGGVLKGQELINSAKVKNMAADFKNTQVYIYGYQDKYKALPGDHGAVATAITGATAASEGTPNNGLIEGDLNSLENGDEACVFWQHVRLAGLAAGTTTIDCSDTGTYLPKNADGGVIGVSSVSGNTVVTPQSSTEPDGISGAFIICSAAILGKFAKQLDTTLDDGNTQTGSVRAVVASTASVGLELEDVTDSGTFTVCMAF